MQLLSLAAFGALWSLLGAAALAWVGEKDRVRQALLGPVIGLALLAWWVSTLSLMGATIQSAAWPLVALALIILASAVWRLEGFNWRSLTWVISVVAVTSVLSIAIVGRELLEVGGLWQGLMNEDAATNSLAAQHFIQHPFYGVADAGAVVGGVDYSVLSTSIYVASGHRFADVMLLGLSAVLTGLHPDQVYMAHALMLRVALILVCASLVYAGRRKLWDVLTAVVVLSVSSIGSYNYLNQLISQTGGIALMVLIMILWTRMLDIDGDDSGRKRTVLLFAIVSAALLRYYPEVAPLLGLAMLVSATVAAPRYDAAQARRMLTTVMVAGLILVAASNLSMPSTIAHVLNTLSIGTGQVVQTKGLMDYAFTPDVFPLLFGFIRFREVVADPWAAVYVAGSCLLAMTSLWAVWKHRNAYSALFAIVASLCITFGFLWFKGEEFGTFKAMLFLQPFVCVAATVVLAKVASARAAALVLSAGIFVWLNASVTSSLVLSAASDVHPVPTVVRADLLNAIESKTRGQPSVTLDLQSYLLQQFASLRQKATPTFFESDPPGPISSRSEGSLATYHSTFHKEWFDSYQLLKQTVNTQHNLAVVTVPFGCGPEPVRSSTLELRKERGAAPRRTIYAGGALQPFNRSQHLSESLIVIDPGSSDRLIAQRESSLGRWEVTGGPRNGERSTFFAETDPMGQVPTMAAVGRYLLLELINSRAEPVSLRIAFSRSFFGPAGARLSNINIHGSTSVSVAGHGSGAIDIVSPPVMPCVLGNHNYLMIDFGSEPEQFKKVPPLLYRAMGIEYVPDSRRSVGFLRDISISKNTDEPSTFQPPWAPKSKDKSVLGYEGIFEDGWLSGDAHIVVRAEPGKSRLKLTVEVDPSLVMPGKEPPAVVIRDQSGVQISLTKLSAGVNMIELPVTSLGAVDVRLTSERTLELPGGDGRRVIGRLSATSLE